MRVITFPSKFYSAIIQTYCKETFVSQGLFILSRSTLRLIFSRGKYYLPNTLRLIFSRGKYYLPNTLRLIFSRGKYYLPNTLRLIFSRGKYYLPNTLRLIFSRGKYYLPNTLECWVCVILYNVFFNMNYSQITRYKFI